MQSLGRISPVSQVHGKSCKVGSLIPRTQIIDNMDLLSSLPNELTMRRGGVEDAFSSHLSKLFLILT